VQLGDEHTTKNKVHSNHINTTKAQAFKDIDAEIAKNLPGATVRAVDNFRARYASEIQALLLPGKVATIAEMPEVAEVDPSAVHWKMQRKHKIKYIADYINATNAKTFTDIDKEIAKNLPGASPRKVRDFRTAYSSEIQALLLPGKTAKAK
jgi:hypothetical protein